jgi:hypothetical protein
LAEALVVEVVAEALAAVVAGLVVVAVVAALVVAAAEVVVAEALGAALPMTWVVDHSKNDWPSSLNSSRRMSSPTLGYATVDSSLKSAHGSERLLFEHRAGYTDSLAAWTFHQRQLVEHRDRSA